MVVLVQRRLMEAHPTPYTLHSTPYTLYTLHTLHPTPYTLYTLHPTAVNGPKRKGKTHKSSGMVGLVQRRLMEVPSPAQAIFQNVTVRGRAWYKLWDSPVPIKDAPPDVTL